MGADLPILPYADTITPAGVDGLQVVRVHDDVRRVVVPGGVSFEVTPFAFRMAVTGPFGVRRSAWPRSVLTDVRLNRLNNTLVLRLTGQDPLEVTVAPTLAATELVMHELIASVTVIPVAPRDRQAVPHDPADGLPPSPARTRLLRAAVALFAVAIVNLWVFPILSFYLGLASIACVGIAFGTQRKDLWP